MKDFSNIPVNINFIGGAFVDIQDSSSEKYLIEYYENTGHGWSLVSYNVIHSYTWFKYVAKQFRVNWKIKIYGWFDNQIKQVCEHTYNESDENVLLRFKTDSYEVLRNGEINSSLLLEGSIGKTSIAAPATCLFSKASAKASISTTFPRELLITKTPFFILEIVALLRMLLVLWSCGT